MISAAHQGFDLPLFTSLPVDEPDEQTIKLFAAVRRVNEKADQIRGVLHYLLQRNDTLAPQPKEH